MRTQYEAGSVTQVDLLQAQDSLVAAQEALAQAHFDVAVARPDPAPRGRDVPRQVGKSGKIGILARPFVESRHHRKLGCSSCSRVAAGRGSPAAAGRDADRGRRDHVTVQVTATWEEILVAATAAGRGNAPLDERVRRHGEYVLSRLTVEADGRPVRGA